MKAIVKNPDGSATLCPTNLPVVDTSRDILVKVKAVAICRTDIYAAEGRLPVEPGRILGHEFAGVVEESFYSNSDFQVGDRVVGNPVLGCRRCSDCRAGKDYLCSESEFLGLELDGAFAEYIAMPSHNLSRIPATFPYPVATFFEPVAAGLGVLEAGISRDESILILGRGRIARLTGEILRYKGFSNFQIDSHSNRNRHYDIVIETEGLTGNFDSIVSCLRPGGKMVIKSRDPEPVEIRVLPIINKRITIAAVKYGSFDEALSFVIENRDLLSTWIDAEWSLEDFEMAFEISKRLEDRKICFQLSA